MTSRIPAFSLSRQNEALLEELMTAVDRVIRSGHFILGKEVEAFEHELAQYVGVQYAIGVGNGSDALYIALRAAGVGPGDEVITTPFTFFATAGAIIRCGATPVFVDVDRSTFNIDPEGIASRVNKRTKAIIPVHLYGLLADMEAITSIAHDYGLVVIEDAAQAIGARQGDRVAGACGDVGCFSFFPTKNLGAFGDAGAVTTNQPKLAEHARRLRVHGAARKYYHEEMGINSRLDALQAAILRVKLPYLNAWEEKRRAIARRYTQGLTSLRAVRDGYLRLPVEPEGYHHVYHQYTIVAAERDALQAFLQERGIQTTVYYPLPLHLQPVFADLGYHRGDLPNAEWLSEHVLSLPMFPELSDDEVDYVINTIRQFYET